MKFLTGKSRTQADIFPLPLELQIASDNEVRFIDVFVDSLQLSEFGFKTHFPENGRPAYHPKDLLKRYIYGYLNGIRSSRKLEKESGRNIEVMWLINSLQPDHNTISNFRKNNPQAIKKVFRQTVKTAQNFNLIGGHMIAGDSTKLRAQNSKKNNYNEKKIERHENYISKKLAEHEAALASNDGDKQQEQEHKEAIAKHTSQKKRYERIKRALKESQENQISTSDPDSRHMITRNNITEVCYNIQSTTDSENNIPIDFKLSNKNDKQAMGNMLQRAKSILRINSFKALYDKGYHTGQQFALAQNMGIETHVAIPDISSTSQAPDKNYNIDKFKYNKESNSYTCPQGERLTTNETWHKGKNYKFQQYKTKACKTCKALRLCTKSKNKQRLLHRSEYQENIEINRKNIEKSPEIYKNRQAIVEHPFGTIKRQWGYNYIITKRYSKTAAADVGLIFTAYNLRRLISLIGIKALLEALKSAFQNRWLELKHSFILCLSIFTRKYPEIKKDKRLEALIFTLNFKPIVGF